MHIHILGICGTFMGGIAMIAKQMGFKVTGSDANVYPPMSTQLEEQGIELISGFDPSQLDPKPDLVVIGNAMKRGNPCVEYILNNNLPFTSGPGWLEQYCLIKKKVLGVAGTHGKTTTASMLAWILEAAGKNPSFLIGGIPENFGISARLTDSEYFVIESDEYDCAFFDKRSKFVHYRPFVQILNNLEYDHADIFANVQDIEKQFHHLVRIIPSQGYVIASDQDQHIQNALDQGCWSNLEYVDGPRSHYAYKLQKEDGSKFDVLYDNQVIGTVDWNMIGLHNVHNALMVLAAAEKIGINPKDSIKYLASFKSPKRRMEVKGVVNDITVYDDFAHHPTAIKTTTAGLRAKLGADHRIIAVLEPRSNTMKLGVHQKLIGKSLEDADLAFIYAPDSLSWNAEAIKENAPIPIKISHDFDQMLQEIKAEAKAGDSILVMSNGGFNGIHQKLLDLLKS